MHTETLSKSVAVEDTAAPPAPVSLGSRSPVGGRGKHTAFHRNSYSELPGSPVTASTTPAEIEFPKASSSLWRKSRIRPGPGAIEPVH